jgi:hypothetical protein
VATDDGSMPCAQQSIKDICGQRNQVPEDEKEDEEDNISPTHSEAAECLNKIRKFVGSRTSDIPDHTWRSFLEHENYVLQQTEKY